MKNKSVVSKILKKIKPYYGYLLLALLSAVISVSLTLYIPVLTGQAVDNIIDAGKVNFENILQILIYIAVGIVGVTVFQWIMNYFTNIISYKTVRDLRREIFDKFNSVTLSYIDSHPHGDLISRVINDVDAVGDGLTQMFLQLFSGIVTIVGTLIFMLMIDWRIALAVVILTPLSLFVAAFIGKLSHKRFSEQQLLQGEISSYVEEHVGNQRIVKAFSYENRAIEDFEKLNTKLYDVGFKAQFAGALANPSTRFVNAMVYAAVGIFGALTAISGSLSVGQLSCFLTYANQYTKPFNEVTGVLTQLQTAIAAAGRVFDVLEAENETPDSPESPRISECKGNVKIENVSFSYKKEKPLIRNFSLDVKSGSKVAIVGPTGCGKTTFINLLMRFYETDSGKISIDGVDINSLSRDNLRRQFGMVLQDSWLFCGTIMENLRYGNENATDEEIISAAKAAYAHSFIRRMPDGYNTVISEGGGNLSQGQKQLLCIARAMLTNPAILILDEATSSIDTLTEIRVQKAFARMMKGKTSFVVAHRLSTIKESDVILVMKDGNIIEQGNHEELLKKGGFYSTLYNSQFAAT
ncbi:ABC transporter ATP-binding protein [Ruminococcus sp.]|uniref:ABC transporter ATP-binding protein n=1 Tax=Ruminococcus sp. TaxID=41978 RepID=UPI00260502A3|nr:ABC transporter ATP-binding protein [Ruminococcus sp.]MDD6989293.1 ABC transporter ATP-binding protein [Ruminococcus sp.]MDY6202147.1 ABC transporter ATP-binding protein [Ruminococcus sp.]